MNRNRKLFVLALAIIILLISYILIYIKPDRYFEGFPYLMNKSCEENNYFIYVDNEFENHSQTKLKCTKLQYDKVVIDPKLQYHIAYEYNSHSPEKGKLKILDFNSTIDNRTLPLGVYKLQETDQSFNPM